VGGIVEQRIVTGGKLGIDRNLAGQDVERARATREAWRLRLRGQLRMLFYDTLAATERTRVRTKLFETAAETAKIARELQNIGRMDEPDIRMADVETQRAAVHLEQARQMETRAWAELAALLNTEGPGPRGVGRMVDRFPGLGGGGRGGASAAARAGGRSRGNRPHPPPPVPPPTRGPPLHGEPATAHDPPRQASPVSGAQLVLEYGRGGTRVPFEANRDLHLARGHLPQPRPARPQPDGRTRDGGHITRLRTAS